MCPWPFIQSQSGGMVTSQSPPGTIYNSSPGRPSPGEVVQMPDTVHTRCGYSPPRVNVSRYMRLSTLNLVMFGGRIPKCVAPLCPSVLDGGAQSRCPRIARGLPNAPAPEQEADQWGPRASCRLPHTPSLIPEPSDRAPGDHTTQGPEPRTAALLVGACLAFLPIVWPSLCGCEPAQGRRLAMGSRASPTACHTRMPVLFAWTVRLLTAWAGAPPPPAL